MLDNIILKELPSKGSKQTELGKSGGIKNYLFYDQTF